MPIRATRLACLLFLLPGAARADDLPRTIATVKASVVGVGTYQRTRSPAIAFGGTGVVVGDGLTVLTNAHVLPAVLDSEQMEALGVVLGPAEAPRFRRATLLATDKEHDLALLRLSGAPLPALALGDSDGVLEGQSLAFTGFPLGMLLGLHPVTHRATLAALTPAQLPSSSSNRLDAGALRQMQRTTFAIFQLDATAYPGNSGSPLYDPDTGTVYGVLNMVFVKAGRDSAITNPSGIAYAIPSNFARALLRSKMP